nr:Hpt domain-containing protein [Rhodopseudomonas palustris]
MTLAASVRSHIEPIGSKLARLQCDFLQRLDNDVAKLERLANTLRSGKARKASLKQIGEIAHGLAGASGVFGFPQLGDLAAELEQAISDGGVDSVDIANVRRSLALLLAGIKARDARANS